MITDPTLLKLFFAFIMASIPLFFVLGGTLNKGIRRYGIPGLILIYLFLIHGFHWILFLSFILRFGILTVGYGDNSFLKIMPAANSGKWWGYIGLILLGMVYCAVNWIDAIWLGWENSKLIALIPAGILSLFAFLIHKEVEGKSDRWTIWEFLGGGMAFASGFATIG